MVINIPHLHRFSYRLASTQITSSCETAIPDTFIILNNCKLQWYIQNNGTLDFSRVNQSGVLLNNPRLSLKVASHNQPYRVGLASNLADKQASEVYTLEGKKLDIAALKRMNAVVIYR
jgi:hypothetical protein